MIASVVTLSLLGSFYLILAIFSLSEARSARVRQLLARSTLAISLREERRREATRIGVWLERAGVGIAEKEFYVALLLLLSTSFLATMVISQNLLVSLAVATLIGVGVVVYLNFRSGNLAQKMDAQLEQFLIDLSASLHATSDIVEAIKMALKETEDPLRREFQRLVDEVNYNISFNRAVANIIRRSKSDLLEIVLIGLVAANEQGTNLIEFLNAKADYVRQRLQMEKQVEILSTEPRITAFIVMVAPLLVILLVSFLNPSYIAFFRTVPGMITLAYSVISYTVGYLLISRLTHLTEKRRVRS